MILKAFALLDTKVGSYSAPFFVVHQGYALRICQDLAGDLATHVGRHPWDFHLYEIGTFDDGSGVLTPALPLTGFGPVGALLPNQPQLGLGTNQDNTPTRSDPEEASIPTVDAQ